MKLHCPHCGVNGTADDSYVGKRVKCPKCQTIFEAGLEEQPKQDAVEVPEVMPVTAAPPKFKLKPPVAQVPSSEPDDLEGDSPAQPAPDPDPVSVEEESGEESIGWEDIVREIEAEDAAVPRPSDFVTEGPPAGSLTDEPLTADLAGSEEAETAEGELEEPSSLDLDAEEKLEPGLPVDAEPVGGEEEIEDRPYGLDGEQCWQCGKSDSGEEPFVAKDGRLYCTECLEREEEDAEPVTAGAGVDQKERKPENPAYRFTVFGALGEAWRKTKGVKGAIWAGSAILYLVMLVLVAGGTWLLPEFNPSVPDVAAISSNIIYQILVDGLSVLFTAGLLVVGIRHVAGKPVSWNMVFDGFPMAAKIVLATILQTLLITIGFLLLVLPGIYLAVGYALTLPLIVDRQMGPWQAMEASRKAIHKVWWKVFAVFFLMGLIFLVSIIPLGIGLIWTWPMFIVLAGVLYRYLFGRGNFSG